MRPGLVVVRGTLTPALSQRERGRQRGIALLANVPDRQRRYKAAYYKGGGTNAGYWDYATQSVTAPGNTIGSGANQANYYANDYAVTQSASYASNQNYLTDVGAFSGSVSAYGTFDQTGNVWELFESPDPAFAIGARGGDWDYTASIIGASGYRVKLSGAGGLPEGNSGNGGYFGFRLASPVAVPEPSTWAMALAGLACGGCTMFRRRKRA